MIPYVSVPSISLGSWTFSTFDVSVSAAVVVGLAVSLRRSALAGIRTPRAGIWVLLGLTTMCAFFGSRLFDLALYRPDAFASDPWSVVFVWKSMSSLGAVVGAVAGAAFGRMVLGLRREDIQAFFDAVGYAIPFAWLPARAGCALVHDHRGIASSHWLAVDFPQGSHFDLGVLEFLYVVPIVVTFWILGRRPRRPGLYLPLFLVLYGPGRFVMDEFRVWDARYLGWTPAQYASLAGAILGLALLRHRQRRAQDQAPS